MALSEREQKVLDQLEELMSNEDPHFASSMSSTGNTAPVLVLAIWLSAFSSFSSVWVSLLARSHLT